MNGGSNLHYARRIGAKPGRNAWETSVARNSAQLAPLVGDRPHFLLGFALLTSTVTSWRSLHRGAVFVSSSRAVALSAHTVRRDAVAPGRASVRPRSARTLLCLGVGSGLLRSCLPGLAAETPRTGRTPATRARRGSLASLASSLSIRSRILQLLFPPPALSHALLLVPLRPAPDQRRPALRVSTSPSPSSSSSSFRSHFALARRPKFLAGLEAAGYLQRLDTSEARITARYQHALSKMSFASHSEEFLTRAGVRKVHRSTVQCVLLSDLFELGRRLTQSACAQVLHRGRA